MQGDRLSGCPELTVKLVPRRAPIPPSLQARQGYQLNDQSTNDLEVHVRILSLVLLIAMPLTPDWGCKR
jgi:hypothetical protein